MSRSHRKPYSTINGVSRKQDRTLASRSRRRTQNNAIYVHLNTQSDWDDFLLPHMRECAHNNPWSWTSDGGAMYQDGKSWAHDRYWAIISMYDSLDDALNSVHPLHRNYAEWWNDFYNDPNSWSKRVRRK